MDEECLISLSKNLIDVQHLLPESFCLNNINLLSNYGLFPSKKAGDLFLEVMRLTAWITGRSQFQEAGVITMCSRHVCLQAEA